MVTQPKRLITPVTKDTEVVLFKGKLGGNLIRRCFTKQLSRCPARLPLKPSW
jgi:hypothetical protein